MMRRYIVFAIVLMLVFGCPQTEIPSNETAEEPPQTLITPVTPPTTEQPPEIPTIPPGYTVNLGDTVWVNYTLWVNGIVIDTNNATLANESGIYNPQRKYEPFVYTVEFNKGVIEGFIINTIGLALNETVYFDVDPARGYGPYDPTKVIVVPRYYEVSNYETVPRAYLEQQGVNISNGTAYNTPYGDVFIDSFNEENVTLFYIFLPGHSFILKGIPQKIVSTDSAAFTATIEYMLEVNKTYSLPHPQTGMPTPFLVTDKTDQNITLDGNHPLANETLTFRVTLVDVIPYQG